MKLSAEQLINNLNKLLNFIERTFEGDRLEKLLKLHNDFGDQLVMAPASSFKHFHGAYAGGYILHIMNVIKNSLILHDLWTKEGADITGYTKSELIFCALCHDLGKLGKPGHPFYLPNDSQWHIDNQGKFYKLNPDLNNIPHSERSLWLLNSYNINISEAEFIGIRVHDGPFDVANQAYFTSLDESKSFKTNLPIILFQADYMAARIESEKDKLFYQTAGIKVIEKIDKKIELEKNQFTELFEN